MSEDGVNIIYYTRNVYAVLFTFQIDEEEIRSHPANGKHMLSGKNTPVHVTKLHTTTTGYLSLQVLIASLETMRTNPENEYFSS